MEIAARPWLNIGEIGLTPVTVQCICLIVASVAARLVHLHSPPDVVGFQF